MHLNRREVFYYLSFVESKFQFILGPYYNWNVRTLQYIDILFEYSKLSRWWLFSNMYETIFMDVWLLTVNSVTLKDLLNVFAAHRGEDLIEDV